MRTSKLHIGGHFVDASDGATTDRANPVTGEIVTRAAAASLTDANAACEAARKAFPAWSAVGPGERRSRLEKAGENMERRRAEFVECMMRETGATAGWSHFNVEEGVRMLREAAAMATQIQGSVIPSNVPGLLSMALRAPIGVCLGIAPWNAPLILGCRAVAMPLVCGNTVILKASEFCPGLHMLIGEVLHEAGLRDGVVNVLTTSPRNGPAIVDALVTHEAVKHVNFTGSSRVGRIIAEKAARALKPVLLELGGKSPMIVLDDADIDDAVNAAVFGSFMNQGQICMSTERIVVDERIGDEFVARFAARADALTVGDPRNSNAILGAMVDPAATARVQVLIEDARDKGAVVAAGGESKGALMAATVIDKVTPAMRIYHEESFGPVTTVVRAKSEDDAVWFANDTEYGLSSAVFSRDVSRALAVAARIDSGICHINSSTVADEPQMPFGGTKNSGYGRFGGTAGIAEFTVMRWVSIQSGHRQYPF